MEIFLDTNVFESASFSYSSKNFEDFIEYCYDNNIKLKIIDIVENEVKKRINSNISEILEPMDKHQLKVYISAIGGYLPTLSKMKFKEVLVDKLKNNFDDLVDDNDIEIVESNYEINELTTLYFKQENPFVEQKKHEFPDAIILLTIKKYINDNPLKTIYTVSNDQSFINFSIKHKFANFNYLSNILSFLIQNPNEALTKAFNAQKDEIEKQIIDYVEDRDDLILYSYDSIDEVYVDDIKINSIEILSLDITKHNVLDKVIEIEASISIDFSCTAYYPDPDSISYDKEDNIYYSFYQCVSKINTKESTICYINIIFDDDYVFEFEDFEIQNKEFEFTLDERFIESTEYRENY
jgi:hypothetical protein